MNNSSSSKIGSVVGPSNWVVLLVDDEPTLLRALTRTLRQQPYQIWTARSAEEAMDTMKAHRVDLVVSDQNMPGMCGTAFLMWVAENLSEVPRIILTGQPSVASSVSAINDAQVYRYFTKPCDVVELALAIRQGLEGNTLVQNGKATT